MRKNFIWGGLLLSGCLPLGFWDEEATPTPGGEATDNTPSPSDNDNDDVPLADCCDLTEVAVLDGDFVVGFALNHNGVAHLALHQRFNGNSPRALTLATASGGSLSREMIEADSSASANGLSFDGDNRPVLVTSTSSDVTVKTRLGPQQWEASTVFAASQAPFVSTSSAADAQAATPLVAIQTVRIEQPGEGTCPGGVSSCFHYAIRLSGVFDTIADEVIGMSAIHVGRSGEQQPVVAWQAGSDTVVARHSSDDRFSTAPIANDMTNVALTIADDGTVYVAGLVVDDSAFTRQLVLVWNGPTFGRTVLLDDTALNRFTQPGISVNANGHVHVVYGMDPGLSDGSNSRLAVVRQTPSGASDNHVLVEFSPGVSLDSAQVRADDQGRMHVLYNTSDSFTVSDTHYLAP